MRVAVVPRAFPPLARSAAFRRLMFRTISQTGVHYRAGPLGEGRAGRVCGGDRVPWVVLEKPGAGEWADNFAPLASLDWQVQVHGEAAPGLEDACRARGLALRAFSWSAAAARAGLARGAAYLVRPDGYVALADAGGGPAALEAYLDGRGLRPFGGAG